MYHDRHSQNQRGASGQMENNVSLPSIGRIFDHSNSGSSQNPSRLTLPPLDVAHRSHSVPVYVPPNAQNHYYGRSATQEYYVPPAQDTRGNFAATYGRPIESYPTQYHAGPSSMPYMYQQPQQQTSTQGSSRSQRLSPIQGYPSPQQQTHRYPPNSHDQWDSHRHQGQPNSSAQHRNAPYHPAALTRSSSSSGASRHECNICGKRFSRPSGLKIHVTTHTGEKPYICPEDGCGRAFSVQSNMRRHVRIVHHGVNEDGDSEGEEGV